MLKQSEIKCSYLDLVMSPVLIVLLKSHWMAEFSSERQHMKPGLPIDLPSAIQCKFSLWKKKKMKECSIALICAVNVSEYSALYCLILGETRKSWGHLQSKPSFQQIFAIKFPVTEARLGFSMSSHSFTVDSQCSQNVAKIRFLGTLSTGSSSLVQDAHRHSQGKRVTHALGNTDNSGFL